MSDQPSIEYSDVWRWNTQTAVPFPNGQIRTDTADWTSATTLNIACLTDAGVDASLALTSLEATDQVYLQHKTDPSRFAQFQVTAASVDCGTYFSVTVSYLDGAGTLPNSSTQITFAILEQPSGGAQPIAVFSLTVDGSVPSHYYAEVNCEHGHTANGVWLGSPPGSPGVPSLQELAETVFANHVLLTGCDCTLEIIESAAT